jgi:hypothetical protein
MKKYYCITYMEKYPVDYTCCLFVNKELVRELRIHSV